MKEDFEKYARKHLAHLFTPTEPWLRECNDIDAEFTYQDTRTELYFSIYKAGRDEVFATTELGMIRVALRRYAKDSAGYEDVKDIAALRDKVSSILR